MKRYVLIVLLGQMLMGCATIQQLPPPQVHQESKHVYDKNYQLGEEKSAYVGEAMIKVKDYYEIVRQADLLSASEAFELSAPPFIHETLPQGSAARVVGTTQRGPNIYRVVQLDNPTFIALRFLLNDDGTFEGSAINTSGSRMGFTYTPNPPTVKYLAKTFTKVDTTKGSKNFEIVYSGTTKDAINLLYREYTPEDLARPAFSQNLTYARDSQTVRFRDIQIKVIDANNEQIRFVVEHDGMAS